MSLFRAAWFSDFANCFTAAAGDRRFRAQFPRGRRGAYGIHPTAVLGLEKLSGEGLTPLAWQGLHLDMHGMKSYHGFRGILHVSLTARRFSAWALSVAWLLDGGGGFGGGFWSFWCFIWSSARSWFTARERDCVLVFEGVC